MHVQLYADGSNAPIGATNVLGRGDGVLGDFSGTLSFTVPEGATHGVLVLSEGSVGGRDDRRPPPPSGVRF